MTFKPAPREKLAFGTAAIAILLRLASDWLFANGGPLPYQMGQAALLGLALVILWSRFDLVFLKDGQHKQSVKGCWHCHSDDFSDWGARG